MRKILILFICISTISLTNAQEIVKQKEVGIIFNNFDSFGLTFRTGDSKSLWRFTALNISGQNSINNMDSALNKQKSYGVGIKLGKEFRKSISENLDFRIGADVSFSFSQSIYDRIDQTISNGSNYKDVLTRYSPGVNLVIGFNYKINKDLIFGAEVLPGFIYTTGTETGNINGKEVNTKIENSNFGLSTNSVSLSLLYKF
jgi:hypothetical protein